jgi:hypothetical protein
MEGTLLVLTANGDTIGAGYFYSWSGQRTLYNRQVEARAA